MAEPQTTHPDRRIEHQSGEDVRPRPRYENVDVNDFARILALSQQQGRSSENAAPLGGLNETAVTQQSGKGRPHRAYETTGVVNPAPSFGTESSAPDSTRAYENSAIKSSRGYETTSSANPFRAKRSVEVTTASLSPQLTSETAVAHNPPFFAAEAENAVVEGNRRGEQGQDSLERQFVLFQIEEARKALKEENREMLAEIISGFLDDSHVRENERSYWSFKLSVTLQYLGRWGESLTLLSRLLDDAMREDDPTARAPLLHMIAEGLNQTKRYDEAKATCTEALQLLDVASRERQEMARRFNTCVELMVRILDAMGQGSSMQSRFYKSKLVDGHVYEAARRQDMREQARQGLEREPERGTEETRFGLMDQSKLQRGQALVSADIIESGELRETLKKEQPTNDAEDLPRTLPLQRQADGFIDGSPASFLEALESAFRYQNSELLDSLLTGRSVAISYNGRTALSYALGWDDFQRTKAIIAMGANLTGPLEIMTPEGGCFTATPVMAVIRRNGDPRILKLLLENGADPNMNDPSKNDTRQQGSGNIKQGGYPLIAAVKRDQLNMVEILLEHGADPNIGRVPRISGASTTLVDVSSDAGEPSGANALHVAMSGLMVKLLVKAGADIHACDKNGRTPLHFAVRRPGIRPSVVDALIYCGASTTVRDHEYSTPLHVAAGFAGEVVVQALCDNGADVNARSQGNTTPLHIAAKHSNGAAIRVLCQIKRVDVNAREGFTETPLHYAARYAKPAALEELLRFSPKKGARNAQEETPLHVAARFGNAEAAEILSKNLSSLSCLDTYKNTPLHTAAQCGHAAVVSILCARGADVNLENNFGIGSTPLDCAQSEYNKLSGKTDAESVSRRESYFACMRTILVRGGLYHNTHMSQRYYKHA